MTGLRNISWAEGFFMFKSIADLKARMHWAIAAIAALIFAVWFAFHQMTAVSPAFRANAPLREYVPTVITTFLVMLCIYGSSLMAIPRTAALRAGYWPATARASGFLASVLIAMLLSPLAGAAVFVLLVVAAWVLDVFFSAATERRAWLLKEYVAPLAVIAVAYCFLIPSVSPFYLYHAASRGAETYLSASTLAMRNYVAAHYYSFSSFTHSLWGAAQDVPTGLTSLPLSILSFLNIFPIWEASSFFKLLSLIHFSGYVLTGYFFYLFLRQSRISRAVALGAALVYVAGNHFFLVMLIEDTGWVLSSFLALSIALWALAVSLRRGSLLGGAWSGVALASQFYILEPHPEVTIYSILTYALVVFAYLVLGDRAGCTRLRAFMISIVAGIAFILLSLSYLTPIVEQMRSGNLVVLGENTIIAKTYALYNLPFWVYVMALAAGTILELGRVCRYRRPRYVFLGFLALAILLLPLSFPGVPRAARDAIRTIGWTVHFLPPDRIWAWLGLATLLRNSSGWIAAWTFLTVHGGAKRTAFANSLLPLVGLAFMVFVVPWGADSDPNVAVIDPRTKPVYEMLQATLANSLVPKDQQSSVLYIRQRLLSFEEDSAHSSAPAMTAERADYLAALKSLGAASVRDLPDDQVRPFANRVAAGVDHAYFAQGTFDDIPENVDGYLAGLQDPYTRVMAVVGKLQVAFLSAGRNVTNAHNNTMMYDTRVYGGFPPIQALYMYPESALRGFRYMLALLSNYHISNSRYPWVYYNDDILGNDDFRKLLEIGGVGAYLIAPEPDLLKALANPSDQLTRIAGNGGPESGNFYLVRDDRSNPTAYLAHVVGTADSATIDELGTAAEAFYRQRLGLDAYRKILDPAIRRLVAMPQRDDAIIEQAPSAPKVNVQPGVEGPESRGGFVKIDGVVGPRIGLKAHCPDMQCTLVYNLAALPGWRAYIDGKPTTISRANYAFLSVPVPEGDHYAAFFYATAGQTISDLASLAVFLTLLIISVPARKPAAGGPNAKSEFSSGRQALEHMAATPRESANAGPPPSY